MTLWIQDRSIYRTLKITRFGRRSCTISKTMSETEEYGIISFVYRVHTPFDPEKLYAFFNQEWPGVVRAKGFSGLQVALTLSVKCRRQVRLCVIRV